MKREIAVGLLAVIGLGGCLEREPVELVIEDKPADPGMQEEPMQEVEPIVPSESDLLAEMAEAAETNAPPPVHVEVGESYVSLLEKLGDPNIDSLSRNCRILIYDEIEIRLEGDLVVKVYDHRD